MFSFFEVLNNLPSCYVNALFSKDTVKMFLKTCKDAKKIITENHVNMEIVMKNAFWRGYEIDELCKIIFEFACIFKDNITGVRFLCLQLYDTEEKEKMCNFILKHMPLFRKMKTLTVQGCNLTDLQWTNMVWPMYSLTTEQYLNLESLELDANEIDNCKMFAVSAILQKCSKIKFLSISKNCFTEDGTILLANAVKTLENLEHIDLSGCYLGKGSFDRVVQSILFCKNLQVLKLDSAQVISSNCFESLFDGLTSLKVFSFAENESLNSESRKSLFSGLGRAESLTNLDLSCTNMHDEDFGSASLLGCTNLETLALGSNLITMVEGGDLFRFILTLQNLVVLDLNNNEFEYGGVLAISKLFSFVRGLKKLILSDNCINDDGAEAIAINLSSLADIEYLDLTRCGITEFGVTKLILSLFISQGSESRGRKFELAVGSTSLQNCDSFPIAISHDVYRTKGYFPITMPEFKFNLDLSGCQAFDSRNIEIMAGALRQNEHFASVVMPCDISELNLSDNILQTNGLKLCQIPHGAKYIFPS